MRLRSLLKLPLRKLGYDIVKSHRTTPSMLRRQQLLAHYEVDLVLDVGADVGHYGQELRRTGYQGRIVSFEPRSQAFRRLRAQAESDPNWEVVNVALGQENTTADINVSRNSYSSSLLGLLPAHLSAEPDSAVIGTERVSVRTLDSLFPKWADSSGNCFLKIDTQGFEKRVVEGSRKSLRRIAGIQMEMSLVPLYEAESLFLELLQFMSSLDYDLKLVEPGIHDPSTGALLQLDGVFFRR
jgi:FkbM family methyltransferase